MKKNFLLLLLLCSSTLTFAFDFTPSAPLPIDSAVRVGVLPNGLTYYIRHNDFVPHRADFYIAQKVGSILEEPQERGLAHFLEHMAFNGTEHYPDKTLINFLEMIGVQFGSHINAYTSVDETVYNLNNVPVERASVVDSCVMILRDWSSGILLKEAEIDKERGVIESEWRTRDNAMLRMYNRILPTVYGKDKYADCLPIGSMNVVRNFKPQVIRAYYEKWYRPDLQGLVIVGDVNVDQVEQAIQQAFAADSVPKNARKRIFYPVSDNKEPIVVTSTDKESPYGGILLAQKVASPSDAEKKTVGFMQQEYCKTMQAMMFNMRIQELAQMPSCPFSYATGTYDGFLLSKFQEAWQMEAYGSPENLPAMFNLLLTEQERMRQHGFTAAEFNRAKARYMRSYMAAYKERNHQKNGFYVDQYVNHFLELEPIPGLEYEFQLAKHLNQAITLEDVNAYAMRRDSINQVIWLFGPEGTTFPTSQELLAKVDSIEALTLAPYAEEKLPTELISAAQLPAAGKIVSKKEGKYGIWEYKLSNGLQVQVKPTDFKKDQILFQAIGKGGGVQLSPIDQAALPVASDMDAVLKKGEFSLSQLNKFLAGKKVNLDMNIADRTESMSGSASVADLETLFQLIYLSFTNLQDDADAYQAYQQRLVALLQNQELDPQTEYQDSLIAFKYHNHPLKKRLTAQQVQAISYEQAKGIFLARFADAKHLKYNFIGNIDLAVIEPLMEQYLATLPVAAQPEKLNTEVELNHRGIEQKAFSMHMDTPKSRVYVNFLGKNKFDLKNQLQWHVLQSIMDLVYFEKVREEQGGTYGVRVQAQLRRSPQPHYDFTIHFETDSLMVAKLLPIVYLELERMVVEGPRPADLQKTKEFMQKVYIDNQRENRYWLNIMGNLSLNDYDAHHDYLKILDKISARDVQSLARKILRDYECKELIQYGLPNTK